jgi:hypothetical protein
MCCIYVLVRGLKSSQHRALELLDDLAERLRSAAIPNAGRDWPGVGRGKVE